MIRIAICDDERIFAKKLKLTVDSIFEKQNIEFQSYVYTDAYQLAIDHNENEYQLIFLDIDMPDISGMDFASRIRAANSNVSLIFVSNHSNFVFESFQFAPLRFIRKEWLKEELPEAIKAYCNEMLKKKPFIKLKLEDKSIISENAEEIIYFFSVRHDIYYATPSGTKRLYSREYTLEKFEEQLSKHGFLRIHKTYLLNYRYVYHIGAEAVELTVTNSESLPISHRRVAEIRRQYHTLMREGDDV